MARKHGVRSGLFEKTAFTTTLGRKKKESVRLARDWGAQIHDDFSYATRCYDWKHRGNEKNNERVRTNHTCRCIRMAEFEER